MTTLQWGFLGLMEINDETSNTNKHNMAKNPNWQEENQLSIHKGDLGFDLGSTEKQIQLSGLSWTGTRDDWISSPAPRYLFRSSKDLI